MRLDVSPAKKAALNIEGAGAQFSVLRSPFARSVNDLVRTHGN